MPALAIIPAVALTDERVSDTQLRVLCTIGTLASSDCLTAKRIAKAVTLSTSTVERALTALEDTGYLRRITAGGWDVCLDAAGPEANAAVPPTPRSVTPTPKSAREQALKAQAKQVCAAIWEVYPKRDTPHLYPPAVRAIRGCLEDGADPDRLRDAASLYASDVLRKGTEPKYVKTIHKFYADGAWEHYVAEPRVYGRTREEWARSGQDVAEFDHIVEGTHAA